MKKAILFYNPFAGSKKFVHSLDYVIGEYNQAGYDLIPFRISDFENLVDRIKLLKSNPVDRVIIAGGDGTIHHVINTLIHNDIDCPIGIFPIGTANDFGSYLGITNKLEQMVEISLGDDISLCDIGLANNDYFINVASLGFVIDVSQKTNTDLKHTVGVFAYYLKAMEELPNAKAVKVKVTSNEMSFEGDIYFMLIMNGKYAGGFKKIAPFASMQDGLLDVFIFKKAPLLELVPIVIKTMNGEHVSSQHVEYFQTDYLMVQCEEQTGTDLDGEKGVGFPMEVSSISKKMKILSRQ